MANYSRMSDSPAPETKEADSKKISFRFCRECSNMLYPKEDRTSNTLLFACRTCNYAENAGASCIYRNSLKETIAETPGNVQDVAQDPTVGKLQTPSSTSKRSLSRSGYRHGRSHGEEEDDDDVLMGDDGEEEQVEDSMGVDMLPDFCTLCGQEILCPICEGPTDAGVMLEAEDPEVEMKKKGQDVVEAEKRERTMSGAGS